MSGSLYCEWYRILFDRSWMYLQRLNVLQKRASHLSNYLQSCAIPQKDIKNLDITSCVWHLLPAPHCVKLYRSLIKIMYLYVIIAISFRLLHTIPALPFWQSYRNESLKYKCNTKYRPSTKSLSYSLNALINCKWSCLCPKFIHIKYLQFCKKLEVHYYYKIIW